MIESGWRLIMSLLEYLTSRKLLKQATCDELTEKITIYCGFDATARSLHVGSLIPLRILKIFKNAGHKTIGLLGSGTTLLGDPTWKSETRPMLDKNEIAKSAASIRCQIERLVNPDRMVDNVDWFSKIGMLEFMRDVASYFSVNQLCAMETFDKRLREEEHLSAMEFYYPLLQSYDFKHLSDHYGCNVQLGGSDQWGNITQGIAFVAKTSKAKVHGLVADLLVNSAGEKMGKSLSGAVYLDENMYSVYDFWQFWRNVSDSDVERFLLQLTDLSEDIIRESLQNMNSAKKLLADEVTSWVHGAEKANEARSRSERIFEQNNYDALDEVSVQHGISLEKILVEIGFASSLSEAKRNIGDGAIKLDGEKVTDHKTMLNKGSYVVFFGKKRGIRVRVC